MSQVRIGDRVELQVGSNLYRGVVTSLEGSDMALLNMQEAKFSNSRKWESITLTSILWRVSQLKVVSSREKGFGKWISQK